MNKNTQKYIEAFKTPTLRNVAERGPYMHAGQLETLREVIAFYNFWPEFMGGIPELEHTSLTNKELKQIEAFLKTLSGPLVVLGMDRELK